VPGAEERLLGLYLELLGVVEDVGEELAQLHREIVIIG
jgi:hypothetical protein